MSTDRPLVIDTGRAFVGETGIFVRAQNEEGKWDSADIAQLNLKSLLWWLRAGGGRNHRCEVTLAMILGHEREAIDACYDESGELIS